MKKRTRTAPRKRAKNIENYTREEIINELRGHLGPIEFQKNLMESTAMLRGLLVYQRDPLKNDERTFPKVGAKHIPVKCACGAPSEHTGKHWPHSIGGMPIHILDEIRPIYGRNWYGKKVIIGYEGSGRIIHK